MKSRKRRRSRARSHSRRRRTHRRNPVRRRRARNPLYVSKRRRRRRGYRRVRLNPIGRRRHRRNPVNFSGFTSSLRELVNKNTLTIAGGAVLGGLAASAVMSRFGPVKLVNGVPTAKGPGEFVLPGSRGQYGPLIYSVAIPLVASAVTPMVLKNQAGRDLSKGMLIGAAVLLIQNVVNLVQGSMSTVAGTGAYVTSRRIRTLGAPQSAIPSNGVSANPLANRSAFRGFGAHAN